MISLGYAHRIGTGEPETGTGAPPNPPVIKLRDQMAMAALTGLLSGRNLRNDVAAQAYELADAMMEERNKKHD